MKILMGFMLALTFLSVNAQASGCDYSCWYFGEKILNKNQYYDVDFDIHLVGSAVVLTRKDRRLPTFFDKPLTLTERGGRQETIHPKLLARIASSDRRNIDIAIMNQEITVEPYSGAIEKFITGRLEIKITFDTAESVTLTYPPLSDMVEDETGELKPENTLPPFFLNEAK
ncbi:hypothetical protein D3C87_1080110 [compost metagenome]